MWETIKNALAGLKDASGIEIPGLPVDMGSLGESATGVVDGATAATEGVASSVAEAGPTAIDSAAQALPDITLGAIGEDPPK